MQLRNRDYFKGLEDLSDLNFEFHSHWHWLWYNQKNNIKEIKRNIDLCHQKINVSIYVK